MAVLIKNADGTTVNTTKTSSAGAGAARTSSPNQQAPLTAATIDANYKQREAENVSTGAQQFKENAQKETNRVAEANTRSGAMKQEAQNKQTARDALNQTNYNDWQNEINANVANREARAQTTMDERNAWAAGERDRRNAELDARRDARIAESEGRINGMFSANQAATEQALRNALTQGIQAQEEARANIARSYQTSANDLSTQYERNKRNLNMQALARGLNTGTGSQQQLALNQGYMKSYGQLRGEESAQNAGIDRAIANLKVNTENEIALALKQNDFQKAQALMDNYNNVTNWAEAQRTNIQNFYDQQYLNNQGTYDTMMANAQNYGDTMSAQNRSQLLEGQRFNQSTYDSENAAANNYLNNATINAQATRDSADATTRSEMFQTRRDNRSYQDTWKGKLYDDTRTDRNQELQLKASFGDASAIKELYGEKTAGLYTKFFGMQNPFLGYANGFISGAEYKAITGQDPPALNGNGGNTGGSGGTWYSWMGDGGGGGDSTVAAVKNALGEAKTFGDVIAVRDAAASTGNVAATSVAQTAAQNAFADNFSGYKPPSSRK